MPPKQDVLFSENTVGINKMFDNCNVKIPEFENQLAPLSSAAQISTVPEDESGFRWKDSNDSRFTNTLLSGLKDKEFKILNFNEGHHGSHSIIILKDRRLPKGWGFFDANGKEGFKDSILRFHDSNGRDVTDQYLTSAPKGAFNPAYFIKSDKALPKNINPGFCGIFGIIFMAFYSKHKNEDNWTEQWNQITQCLLTPYTPKRGMPYKFSLVVAREVLKIINARGNKDTKVMKINDILEQACSFIGERSGDMETEKIPERSEVIETMRDEIRDPQEEILLESNEVSCNDDEPQGFGCTIMGGGRRRKRRGTLYTSPSNRRPVSPKYKKKVMGILKQQVSISKKLASSKITKKVRKKLLNKKDFEKSSKRFKKEHEKA